MGVEPRVLEALGLATRSSECESSSVEGWWPACPFSPLGGRAGSHLLDSTVCSATGADKEGIFPAGAAQGNVSISQHSLSPQDMAGGKPAWAKEWCKQEFVFSQRESVRKPLFLCRGCFFFLSLSLLLSIFALSGKLKLLLVMCLHTERCWSTHHHLAQPPLGETVLGNGFKMEVFSTNVRV